MEDIKNKELQSATFERLLKHLDERKDVQNIDLMNLFVNGNPNVYIGGDNVIFWGPLAWTVIFGLTFATFLTLIIVPVTFYLSKRLALKIRSFKLY